MNKTTGKLHELKYKSEPFFTFHHVNSYEQDGCLIVDYCKYEKPGTFEFLSLQELREGTIALNMVWVREAKKMLCVALAYIY